MIAISTQMSALGPPEPTQASQRARTWPSLVSAACLVALMLASGIVSVCYGTDQMWDLKNYHFYNPFEALHGRYEFDVAPAQQQSYFNPLLDYPFYLLIRLFNAHPRWVAFAMGLPQGVNLWLVGLIAWRCQHARLSVPRAALAAVCVLIGGTGAATLPLVGTTTGDLFVAVPTLAALATLLSFDSAGSSRRLLQTRSFLAGLLAGCAFGLKPTTICFALSLAPAAAALVPVRVLPRILALLALGGGVGAFATGGYHAFRLWQMFGDPVFPLVNGLFRSPFWEPASLRDARFLPKTALEALIYPLRWGATVSHGLVSELDFRDARVCCALGLIAVAAVAAVVERLTAVRSERGMSRPEAALLVFTATSYAIWVWAFAIYRYLIPVEMLSGVVIVVGLGYLVRDRALPALVAVAAGGLWATTVPLEWGHAPFGDRYIQVSAVPVSPDSLVLIVGTDPVSYLVPFIGPGARWLSLANNFLRPGQTNRLIERERAIIAGQKGPIRVLDAGAGASEVAAVLAAYGLVADEGRCDTVSSNLGAETYRLCHADRM